MNRVVHHKLALIGLLGRPEIRKELTVVLLDMSVEQW